MTESTNEKDQHDPGTPQVTGGGGHEPDEDTAASTETPTPSGGAGHDLKSSDLPET
jgi:hypothetical protein